MTSIQQRDAQSVLAGIDELLPKLRERAQEALSTLAQPSLEDTPVVRLRAELGLRRLNGRPGAS